MKKMHSQPTHDRSVLMLVCCVSAMPDRKCCLPELIYERSDKMVVCIPSSLQIIPTSLALLFNMVN